MSETTIVEGSEVNAWTAQQWDQGKVLIQTKTIPSDKPIITSTPREEFIGLIKRGWRNVDFEKMLSDIRHSVATEGEHLHDDLPVLLAYTLTLALADAKLVRAKVGVLSQKIIVEELEDGRVVRGTLPASLVKPYIHPESLLTLIPREKARGE